VAQVGDGFLPEGALGLLDKEALLVKDGKDRVDMPQMLGPGVAKDQDVVEKDEDKAA
jgi:hypothetical protein